jgi:hypothetical protein
LQVRRSDGRRGWIVRQRRRTPAVGPAPCRPLRAPSSGFQTLTRGRLDMPRW